MTEPTPTDPTTEPAPEGGGVATATAPAHAAPESDKPSGGPYTVAEHLKAQVEGLAKHEYEKAFGHAS